MGIFKNAVLVKTVGKVGAGNGLVCIVNCAISVLCDITLSLFLVRQILNGSEIYIYISIYIYIYLYRYLYLKSGSSL